MAATASADDEVDRDYMLFLAHLRADGKSYALELPAEGSHPPIRLKYEPTSPSVSAAGDGDEEYSSDVIQSSPGSPSCRGGSKRPREEEAENRDLADEDYRVFLRHARVVDGRVVLELDSFVVNYEVDVGVGQGGGDKAEEAADPAVVELGKEEAAEAAAADPAVVELGQEEAAADPAVVELGPEEAAAAEEPRREGSVIGSDAAVATNLDGNVGNASNRTLGVGLPPDEGPSEPMKFSGLDDNIWPRDIINRSPSLFKTRLMRVLRSPFDQDEYEKLLEKATLRTRKMKLKNLRNDSIFYETDELGYSFFDHYPDLAEQVHSADYPRGLCLLRGFFFWLENVGHEGSFRPWAVASKGYKIVRLNASDNKP